MNVKHIGMTAAAASILACSAFAADRPLPDTNPDRGRPGDRMDRAARDGRMEGGPIAARSSDIVGIEVQNLQGEKLGKVENLILDMRSGRVLQIIVSSGGFLGLGDELSALPPAAFHYDAGQKVLHLDMTKEALTQAPHFKSQEWPDFNGPAYVGPGRNNPDRRRPDPAHDADNSGRNVRDRQNDRLTPTDQSSDKGDVEITRQIRRALQNEKTLSVNAHNVKIITANGKVTLRGPVNSDQEKQTVAEIASRVTQADNLDNQLEVKQDSK